MAAWITLNVAPDASKPKNTFNATSNIFILSSEATGVDLVSHFTLTVENTSLNM